MIYPFLGKPWSTGPTWSHYRGAATPHPQPVAGLGIGCAHRPFREGSPVFRASRPAPNTPDTRAGFSCGKIWTKNDGKSPFIDIYSGKITIYSGKIHG